jgi:peptide-methionine (S)-S-oxide reductase
MQVPERHDVLGTPLQPPFPEQMEQLVVGMGCFWGAERVFWQADGVYTTAVGYAGGYTPNPTYEEVCSGRTGHTEAVLVVFDPAVLSLDGVTGCSENTILPGHAPGNDHGTGVGDLLGERRAAGGRGNRATCTRPEARSRVRRDRPRSHRRAGSLCGPYHQHLAKNPNGYCGQRHRHCLR